VGARLLLPLLCFVVGLCLGLCLLLCFVEATLGYSSRSPCPNDTIHTHTHSKEGWAQALAMHIAYLDIFMSTTPATPWTLANEVSCSHFRGDLKQTFAAQYVLQDEEIGSTDNQGHLGLKAQLWVPADPRSTAVNVILFRGTQETPTKVTRMLGLGSGMSLNMDSMGYHAFQKYQGTFRAWVLRSNRARRGLLITGHSLGKCSGW
jgi:hypothetical protein